MFKLVLLLILSYAVRVPIEDLLEVAPFHVLVSLLFLKHYFATFAPRVKCDATEVVLIAQLFKELQDLAVDQLLV